MAYLLAQIFFCLVGAFLLGAVLVWWFTRHLHDRGVREGHSQATARVSTLETELAAAREGMSRYRERSQALEKDLAALRDRMESVRRDLEIQQRKQSTSETGTRRVSDDDVPRLRNALHRAEEAAKNSAARAGELEALVNSQKGKLASLNEEVESLVALRRELYAAKSSLRQREERIRVLEADQGPSRSDADAAARTRIATLEAEVRERDAHIHRLAGDIQQIRTTSVATARQKDEEIAQLRAQRVEPPTRTKQAASKEKIAKDRKPPKKVDDLKRIKGIGVALERLLHKHGVYTFQQIANWTKADIDTIDAKLDKFKGRIRRDNWVAQARKISEE